MSLQLTITIPDGSRIEQVIEETAHSENISREEAVLHLLDTPQKTSKATPEAMAILGAGRDHVELIDEIMELVMSDRERHNAEPPRDL